MAYLTSPTTLVFLLLLLFLRVSISLSSTTQSHKTTLLSRRILASIQEEDDEPVIKPPPKKNSISEAMNHTKSIKPKKTNSTTSTDSKVKLPKSLDSITTRTTLPKILVSTTTTKSELNKTLTSTTTTTKSSTSTKLIKPIKLSKNNSSSPIKSQLKSLNSTSKPLKSPKQSSDLPPPKTMTSKKSNPNPTPQQQTKPKTKLDPNMSWLDEEEYNDIISDFRELPARLLPDLAKISTTSKVYITKANKEMAQSFKPYVGSKYATTIASVASTFFLLLPVLLLPLLFNKLRNYLSLQRALIFMQAYLAIYFATLAITALLSGLEPLRFFYATSPTTYACMQALQTVGYVVYLVVQLVNLVAVVSAAGMAQMVVGLAVGMHYYVAVFHRAVAGEPPRANWKVHGMYALCFVGVCALARAERRKKAYLNDGGEEGKKS